MALERHDLHDLTPNDVAKVFGIAAQFKAIQPREEAPKTEGKCKYDDDDFYHKGC